jgi:hypothetical protein
LQDSTSARVGLYALGITMGDDDLARAQVEAVRGRRDEMNMIGARIQVAHYQGRFREARELGAEWAIRMEQDGRHDSIGERAVGTAIAEVLVGNDAEGVRMMADLDRQGFLTPGSADEQLFYAMVRKEAGLARRIYPVAVKELGLQPDTKRALDVMLALAEGRAADAFRVIDPPLLDAGHLQQAVLWTLAAMAAERPAEAVKGFEFVNGSSSRVALAAIPPWMMVQHARTLAALGRHADARAAYDRFFTLWKDADADVPLLVQARRESEKLGT